MQIEVLDSRKLQGGAKALGERVSEALRQRYGAHAAKQAARITGADLRTAQGWISEHRAPREDHLLAIIRAFGRDAVTALFGPEIYSHEQKLEQEIHALREEEARLVACLQKSRAPSPDQMAVVSRRGTCAGRVNQNRLRRVRARSGRAYRRPGHDR